MTSARNVVSGVIKQSTQDMAFLMRLVETGKMVPVIDRSYQLDQIPEAHTYVEKGHKKGNVLVEID